MKSFTRTARAEAARLSWPGVRRLTVQGWLQLTLAALGVLTVAGAVLGGVLLQRTASVTDDVLNSLSPAQAQAYQLQAALIDQETGVRGYAATADPQFLQPYTAGQATERESIAQIRHLISGRPQLLADLTAIEQAAASWRGNYVTSLLAGITPGDPRPADLTSAENGKADFDRIRTLFASENQHLSVTADQERTELSHTRAVRDTVLIGLIALFLVTSVVLAVLLRILVIRPLETLRTASRRVAGGDFGLRIEVGGPADVRALAQDVESMRKGIVDALQSAQAQRDQLTRQTDELDKQAVELRRSNAELEQFAYVASHDLQEPLRKVASFCQLLDKRYGSELDQRGKQYIDFAVDGAKRMQILINDLLTFSRVGRLGDAFATVSLDHCLDKATANLATAIEDSGAEILRPETLPEVTGDATLLTMLWQNLIANSVKFRHPDRAPRVRITCEPHIVDGAEGWQFAVTDNGLGIPPEFAEKIFVIFQRLHSREDYAGTGIGLAVCKKIIEYHGGTIAVDTSHTDGARFVFAMPASRPSDKEPE